MHCKHEELSNPLENTFVIQFLFIAKEFGMPYVPSRLIEKHDGRVVDEF